MLKKDYGNKYIGAHVSAAGGVDNAPMRAREIGANAFALFTKNQRQWVANRSMRKRLMRLRPTAKCWVLPANKSCRMTLTLLT